MESNKVRLYTGFFSIILIAMLMTVFELIFYIYIVNPNVTFFIGQLLENQPQEPVEDRLENLIIVLKNRERALINEINIGAYIIIVVEIVFMLTLLAFVYMKILINRPGFNIYLLKGTVISSLSTIFILISFQVMFFYFGLNYYYMGRFGINEIKKRFADVYLA